MKRLTALIFAGVLLLGIFGCDRKAPKSAQDGKMIATSDFQKYFGVPPAAEKGTSYAFVIYFPSAKNQDEVIPLPFFTFDEQSMKKVAIERLFAGMDMGSYRGEVLPFPNGTRLLSLNQMDGTVTVNLTKEAFAASTQKADNVFPESLGLTLRQFNGVKDVRIQIDGKDSPSTTLAANRTGITVGQQTKPRLLALTAMRDKGAKYVEEVNAFFDRPVNVKEVKFLAEDGREFSGDIYHAVFDMAAVLKPKRPAEFIEKMPIKVRWNVVDKLGRQAEGENLLLLEVKEH